MRQKKKVKKNNPVKVILPIVVGVILLVATTVVLVTASGSPQDNTDHSQPQPTVLELIDTLVANSESTDELYVTDLIKVGQNEVLKPGVYDLIILGGYGNIMGNHSSMYQLSINWIGAAENTSNRDKGVSSLRIILLEGDELEFSNISKIQFKAIPEKASPSNQLGIGEFVVGRDIAAGTYKLSTNMKMDATFGSLGWNLSVYDDTSGTTSNQTYNPDNNDVVVSLKDGQVVSTSFYNTDYLTAMDDARLIFTSTQ